MNNALKVKPLGEDLFKSPLQDINKEILAPTNRINEHLDRVSKSAESAAKFLSTTVTKIEGVSDLEKDINNVTKNLGQTFSDIGK